VPRGGWMQSMPIVHPKIKRPFPQQDERTAGPRDCPNTLRFSHTSIPTHLRHYASAILLRLRTISRGRSFLAVNTIVLLL
jgi:hypothetical protein